MISSFHTEISNQGYQDMGRDGVCYSRLDSSRHVATCELLTYSHHPEVLDDMEPTGTQVRTGV